MKRVPDHILILPQERNTLILKVFALCCQQPGMASVVQDQGRKSRLLPETLPSRRSGNWGNFFTLTGVCNT
jgi:hypothetical protein